MSTKKDRNVMDLIKAEDIRKRCKNIQNYTKKDLHYPDNHDGVITHQSQTSWSLNSRALGSITTNKASGGDGIPV